jgi:hypothetical protein
MERPPDPAPAVLLALYAATVLPACLWSGLGLAAFGFVLAADANQDPLGLALASASALASLARLAGGLASAAFAAHAAWRWSNGEERLARPATLAALAVTLLAAATSVLTCDCCSMMSWIVPGVFAVAAMVLIRQAAPGEHAHPGWGGPA